MKPEDKKPNPKPYGDGKDQDCEDDGIQGGPVDDKSQPWTGPPPPPPPET